MAAGVGLNTLFVIIEAASGLWGGSLALVADAGHNAGDVIGLLLAWGASRLARRPPSRRYTWGFRRTTIYAAGRTWIDPLVSMVITLVIVVGTWDLFRESIDLALDAVPRGVDPDEITKALAAIPGVVEVHDLHVWAASTSEVSLTAHLVVPDADSHKPTLLTANDLLRDRFRIAHTTIQLECDDACRACVQRPAEVL